MTINVPLLDRIEQQITQHPETWRQSTWFRLPDSISTIAEQAGLDVGAPELNEIEPPCGTAYCVAGHAAAFTGWRPCLSDLVEFESSGLLVTDGTRARYVDAVALEVLGLTRHQADRLFNADNGLGDLRRIFAELRELAAEQAQGGEPR